MNNPTAPRNILITGATKGIGLALAKRLSKDGDHVIGFARQENPEFPGEFIAVDLSDASATAAALTELTCRISLSAVVNNVGLVKPQPLGAVDLLDFAQVLDLNLRTALQVTQAALPAMTAAGWGRIINISSLTVLGVRDRSAYAAVKAALISFTRTWALELAETGVTANAIAPGPVETELFRRGSPKRSESEARFLAAVPMRRFGQPDEIAAAIAFLLSEDAAIITGQTLFVDGGASIGKASI